MRRSRFGLIALPMIGLLLLPAVGNIAANTVPDSWKPYLWVAWPVGVLLAVPMIRREMREHRSRQGHLPGAVEEQQAWLRRAAHDLAQAVHHQWTKEAGLRSLRSPEPIRISWSSTGQPVAADLSRVLTRDAVVGRPLRLRGDVRQVTTVLGHVRARQLVVLGEPTAGKSVVALLLTLGPLPGEPVPVLLSMSSWNPHHEELHTWVSRRIVEEYPALANSDSYGPDVALRLLTGKRVMPVLDGLDEMAAALRPAAVNAIDRAVTDQYPLVVTCRTAEYRDAVEENGRFLAHAAVLEIQPVDIDDAADFLRGANPRSERWQPLLDHLRSHPEEPAALALRSPLMIDLARTAYATGKPADLLDTDRFPDRAAVERHLLGAFLRSAYEDQPGPARTRYSAERAGEWLRFLANSKTLGDHDLAWWHLVNSLPRLTMGVVVGLLTGLVLGFAEGYLLNSTYGLVFGLTFGVAVGFAFCFGHVRAPTRIEIRVRGHGRSLRDRFAASLAICLGLTPVAGPVNGIMFALVFMVALTAHLWLSVPPDVTTASSPVDVLRQDRRAALVLGGVLVVAFGPVSSAKLMTESNTFLVSGLPTGMANSLISALVGAVIGTIMGGFVFGKVGAITFGIAGAVAEGLTYHVEISVSRLLALAAGTAFGLVLGGLGVLSRAWGAFAFARFWFALRGRSPWFFMRFLDDAHRRGVLRQSGTVYQFRHERVQAHLAAGEHPTSRAGRTVLTTGPNGGRRPGRRCRRRGR